jgi:RHS repeat-associated protein
LTYSQTVVTLGAEDTNYYHTDLAYDARGRLTRELTPTNTIYRTVYDGLSRVVSTWVGTDDTGATNGNPGGNGSPSNNMVQVTASTYDGGSAGDSNLTRYVQYPAGPGGPGARAEVSSYDWRDRLVAVKQGDELPQAESTATNRPILYYSYDNLDEVVKTQRYDGDGVTLTDGNGDGVPDAPAASLLRAQSTVAYDDQRRLYNSRQFSVDPSNGTVGVSLSTDTWYDYRGHTIKETSPGGLTTKSRYDGAGRLVTQYQTDASANVGYSAATQVSGDAVLQQTEYTYDGAGNVTLQVTRQRFHDEGAVGELMTPTAQPRARVSYVARYYDPADRLVATVDVGTFGGQPYPRPGSVPNPDDLTLVSRYDYNPAGWLETTTDPRTIQGQNLRSKNFYDNLGRVTKTVEAFTNGTPTNATDKTTEYTYDGGNHVRSVTARLPGAVQTTAYVYAARRDTGSAVSSFDALSAVQYPDKGNGGPNPNDQEVYTVNGLRQNTSMTDRNGTRHTYGYDPLGRLVADAVTVLGSGVDPAVQRLETAFDGQGKAWQVTSYDSLGNVVNQVQRSFNGLGQLTGEAQAHAGAVQAGTPQVQYGYSTLDSTNRSRLVSMTYPNGKVLTYNYSTQTDNDISRLTSLSDGGGMVELYAYLGLGTVVQRSRAATYLNYVGAPGDGGDQYRGLDRFGRVVDQRWQTNGGTDLDRNFYGYDADGNRLYRSNELNHNLDELYHVSGAGNGYDSLNQLVAFARGPLNGARDTVAAASRSQNWSLDAVGNWTSVTTDGTTQGRVVNQQNEVTSITSAAPAVALTYDGEGNLTRDERGRLLVYDAWNRLVHVQVAGGYEILGYQYDGLGRRIKETAGANTRDLYYSAEWQVIEERVNGQAQADVQYVWSPVYVDALVLRDRNADPISPDLEERLFVQQDANWNVTALVTPSGQIVERYSYDPYGRPTFLSGAWLEYGKATSGSAYAWLYLHQGGRYDASTGLYEFRHRAYSPTLGRWLSLDPLGSGSGDMNFYRYEGNRPTTANDPTGLETQTASVRSKDGVINGVLGAIAPVVVNGDEGIYSIYQGPNANRVHFIQIMWAELIAYKSVYGSCRTSKGDLTLGRPETIQKVYLQVSYTDTAGHTTMTSEPGRIRYFLDSPPGTVYYAPGQASGVLNDRYWVFDAPNAPEYVHKKLYGSYDQMAGGPVQRAEMNIHFTTYLAYQAPLSVDEEILGSVTWDASSTYRYLGPFTFGVTSVSKTHVRLNSVTAGPGQWERHKATFQAALDWLVKEPPRRLDGPLR